jgi:hypothetical protein
MLSKGVMQKYQHEKPRFITNENHLCGVTHAEWVTKRSGQYAILSGGEDGINKSLHILCLILMPIA